jgi:hypothetical protein
MASSTICSAFALRNTTGRLTTTPSLSRGTSLLLCPSLGKKEGPRLATGDLGGSAVGQTLNLGPGRAPSPMILTNKAAPGYRRASDPRTRQGSGEDRSSIERLELELAQAGHPCPEVEARRLWAARGQSAPTASRHNGRRGVA